MGQRDHLVRELRGSLARFCALAPDVEGAERVCFDGVEVAQHQGILHTELLGTEESDLKTACRHFAEAAYTAR